MTAHLKRLSALYILLFAFSPLLAVDPPAPTLLSLQRELIDLQLRAAASNPRLTAACKRVEQALASHEELLDFFDPALYAALGVGRDGSSVPGSTTSFTATDSTELEIGIEAPFEPGVYLSVGGAERYLDHDNDADPDRYFQSMLGLALRVPLLRDRNFAQWRFQRSATLAEHSASIDRLTDIMQQVRRDVELAYIEVHEAKALYVVGMEATRRFEALLAEARELVRLQVVPEYQLAPATMELALRRSDELSALERWERALTTLEKTVGDTKPVQVTAGPEMLLKLTAHLALPPLSTPEDILHRRGVFRAIFSEIDKARAERKRAREDMKDDLEFRVGAMWTGEEATGPFGGQRYGIDENFGSAASLVWRRAVGTRGAQARQARQRARIAELKEQLREGLITIKSDLAVNKLRFERTSERLSIVTKAKLSAETTLSAEQERFRLGEGRSRNVLDAQKDLTAVNQRQALAAGALLRAWANLKFIVGYAFGPSDPTLSEQVDAPKDSQKQEP
ncbi:MAG: TolC family protein [Lentisphaeria bacterium]|nr:TolC family protein [Lentisphaeria bacterium]